jgi:hypothetical protein
VARLGFDLLLLAPVALRLALLLPHELGGKLRVLGF